MALNQVLVLTTPTRVCRVVEQTRGEAKTCLVANSTEAGIVCTMWATPAGTDTPGDVNLIVSGLEIPTGQTLDLLQGLGLLSLVGGEALWVQGASLGLSATVCLNRV